MDAMTATTFDSLSPRDGRVVGTFAVLSRQPGPPTSPHQRVIAEVTHLASIAIAHKRNETALR